MSRFETTFAQLHAQNEGAFVPFVTLCDPTFDRSFDIICTLVDNEADALELGFPFSDPLLDGPVIQAANNRALNAGHSTENSFKLLEKVRSKYPEIPMSLLLCANLIFAKGLDNFYQRCADVGVDAVLVADIPLLAKDDYVAAAKRHGIQPVFICPPNADEKTIQDVAQNSEGYTYLVSRAGVTGAENQSHTANLDSLVERLKAHHAAPILQGFGIAQPAQVKEALQLGAAGAISGSATVKIIARNLDNHAQCLTELGEFVRNMKAATK
ncbi:tryptophan synthase subunit alpha [Aggregatibacter actinomycetemcomitans]|uniref:tryptophan synthase subunit alpha n=1 Tax=Aggregatibacter actinomycetemcomitans TaxID=714 RepID=UPI00022C0078|nr:tryptophan synthase subunit alpha [Aggregatibacter actinomycetemcomitans]AEW77667.1 tryptophan synthase, alpha subunit [Aggregatibacter actinomycetemcomitans ANH9381]AMQ91780.1 tryptophan synthase subunit alpha [Aggregatibacter actinomycetemcomitans]KOE54335.1 tryptophan synthase subunit alpha [Aggregatibacter actinomycetemcomitans serotype b str. I23C]KOE55783.1 tryptophan synthase subunit alpha [Aggregatibacter actinomycetemcomitans serotype b str. S23A]MBN6058970.1 tryptophan synthase su